MTAETNIILYGKLFVCACSGWVIPRGGGQDVLGGSFHAEGGQDVLGGSSHAEGGQDCSPNK